MVIFTSQLAAALGPAGTIGLFAQYGFTAWVLKAATPAFGRMAATEARLEGEYRAGLGRIGRDGEEVAYVLYFRSFALLPVTLMVDRFYNGGKRENGILSRAYDQVAKHVHTVFKVRQYHSFTPASMLIDRLEYLTGKLTCDGNHES